MHGLFESSIHTAIVFEDSPRFNTDPGYGKLLKHISLDETTEEDVELLNTRVVGTNGVTLPGNVEDTYTSYVCPLNK